MIEHVWTVVCRQAVVDRETNLISLQAVFEGLQVYGEAPEGGIVPAQFDVASLWIRSDNEIPAEGLTRVKLISPSGNELLASDNTRVNLVDTQRFRTITHFPGFPSGESGRYIIRIELDQEGGRSSLIAGIPLMVEFLIPERTSVEEEEGEPQTET